MSNFNARDRIFIENYNDYFALVYSIIHSKLGHEDDTRDLTQEIFTRFLDKIESVKSPRKWLLGTLRNVLYEHYRKNYDSEVNLDSLFEDISLSFVNGFRDTRMLIEEALEDPRIIQDDHEWILLQLIAVHHFSYKEAGIELGLSERQTRYRYGLLVNRLISHFQRRGVKHLEELL